MKGQLIGLDTQKEESIEFVCSVCSFPIPRITSLDKKVYMSKQYKKIQKKNGNTQDINAT